MAVFDLGGLVRADELTRVQTYQAGVAMGLYSLDYVQKREQLPPNAAPKPPEPTRKDVPVAAAQDAALTFADDDGFFGFETDEGALAFEVDTAKREIFGLAVPYGVTTTKNGVKYQFSQGTLKYGAVGRVKLLDYHDRKKAVGAALKLTDSPEGLWARFKVARGAEGDRVLELAEDGVYDGLSIGLGNHAKFRSENGVNHAVSAPLAEISILPFPSFDDARVTAVTATADEGTTMTGTTAETTEPANVPVTLSADTISAIGKAFADALPTQKPQPKVIPAAGGTGATFVKEEALYRFEGEAGEFDFSRDLIDAGINRDPAARERLDKFMELQFATATTDVNEANPTVYRPEMYVDNLAYESPIFTAIRKGSLADITPFSYAAWNSASTVVSDHVEGTEPTVGTFTLTGDTVTPTALSGKFEINREVWDQVGNPQISDLIWREIRRSYAEGLETAAVAYLDSLTPTGITIPAGSEDDTLEDSLTAALAALNYIRGGYRMRDFFVQVDLFKKLIAAVDGNGRKLFPVVGPSNASGTVAPYFGSVDVGGLIAKPSWALAATGSVAASSYLFAREDVSAWATPPRRLDFDFQVKSLFVGVWGYKAFKCTRLAGVREVIYDPVA
jgi:HK97 family phage prohead protease